MVDEIKNIFLAGIGSAAYTYEKASKLVDELVAKGKLTIDEGKDISQELRRNFKDKAKETSDKIIPLTKEDMKELLAEMNFVTRNELDEIENRLLKLENNQK
ncbi:phasin family protein [Clostridium aestuarii]|uniref:Phasin family protein n=1 Tax=Clostridium aestuarii TaxID=338193 RepID=A0ABT4D5D3_9CLOT|nr:phasin family protein [Clostridium aestuarii]MCY6485857.1 phasin family protein [Clostridium aestuarii]